MAIVRENQVEHSGVVRDTTFAHRMRLAVGVGCLMLAVGATACKKAEKARDPVPASGDSRTEVIVDESATRVRHLVRGPNEKAVHSVHGDSAVTGDGGRNAGNDTAAFKRAMQTYFVEATMARDAVIQGELGAAQQAFSKLANYPLEMAEAPESWVSTWKAWQHIAVQGSRAGDLASAAAKVGELGAQCYSCHQTSGLGPKYEPSGWTEPTDKLRDHMHMFEWAMDRMWEGLTSGWDRAWTVGASTIAEERLSPQRLQGLQADRDARKQWSAQLRQAAKLARAAKTPAERGVRLGEVLAVCADCHSRAR